MSELVSVIIPVYNVEQYLEECMDSVLNQTYTNLEIILIDDGSTDTSGILCDKYAEKDSRVRVIHQANGGAGKAKNTGLERMTGSLVVFVDSDDLLPVDSIEYRVAKLEEYQADIVQGCFCEFSERWNQRQDHYSGNVLVKTKMGYLADYLKNWENAIFWNKIFKCEVLKGLQFPVGRCIDDEFYTYKAVFQADKIILTDYVIYGYRIRSNSAIHNTIHDGKKIYDQIDFMYFRYLDIKKNYPQLKKIYLENLVDNYIQFSRKEIFTIEHKAYMKNKLQQIKRDLLFVNYPIHLKYQIVKSVRGKN